MIACTAFAVNENSVFFYFFSMFVLSPEGRRLYSNPFAPMVLETTGEDMEGGTKGVVRSAGILRYEKPTGSRLPLLIKYLRSSLASL